MKMITVQIKTVYGIDQVYPASPEAKIFAQIAGTKTLTHATLDLIKGLGYVINVANPFVRAA